MDVWVLECLVAKISVVFASYDYGYWCFSDPNEADAQICRRDRCADDHYSLLNRQISQMIVEFRDRECTPFHGIDRLP